MSNSSYLGEGLLAAGLAGGAILLLGGAASTFIGMSEMQKVYKQQRAELDAHPETFVISSPQEQPPGKVIATWDSDSSSLRLRWGTDDKVSLSDAYEPSAILGRRSAPVVPCASLKLKSYTTHSFEHTGKSYRVIQTYLGNAAVCSVSK